MSESAGNRALVLIRKPMPLSSLIWFATYQRRHAMANDAGRSDEHLWGALGQDDAAVAARVKSAKDISSLRAVLGSTWPDRGDSWVGIEVQAGLSKHPSATRIHFGQFRRRPKPEDERANQSQVLHRAQLCRGDRRWPQPHGGRPRPHPGRARLGRRAAGPRRTRKPDTSSLDQLAFLDHCSPASKIRLRCGQTSPGMSPVVA